jgi:hypothetical protein
MSNSFDIEAKLSAFADAIETACHIQVATVIKPAPGDYARIDAACATSARLRAEIIAAFPKHPGFVGECHEV